MSEWTRIYSINVDETAYPKDWDQPDIIFHGSLAQAASFADFKKFINFRLEKMQEIDKTSEEYIQWMELWKEELKRS